MRLETTRDMLHHARDAHALIAKHFHKLADQTDDARVRLLLDYLEQHEQHLQSALNEYEADAPGRILNSWFPFTSCEQKLEQLKSLFTEHRVSTDAVIDQVLALDECIMDMYRKITQEAELSEVREMFKRILKMEENEQRRVVKNAMRLDIL
jgi:rubrerythrin